MAGLQEVRGTVTRIVYQKDNFTIASVDTEEGALSVLGEMVSCFPGREYVFHGEYGHHPKFGRQFKFRTYEEAAPRETDGIVAFLSSGIIKGVGPKKAMAIADRFGEETFSVIEENPERLAEVSGITAGKAADIARAYEEHRDFAEVAVTLQTYGFSISYTMRLYEEYGVDAPHVVEEDPFQLMDDIEGFGFRRADEIARKMGVAADSEGRIRGGLRYILNHAAGRGDTYLPERELIERAGEMLDLPMELIEDTLTGLLFEGYLQKDTLEGQAVVYLPLFYGAENYVAARLAAMAEDEVKPIDGEPSSVIDLVQRDIGLTFSEEQREAILACITNGVLVITGGPGTGKTTIINGILRVFAESGIKTALAAPTGRAAKRITETTGYEASTIHRLLEYTYQDDDREMRFGKDERSPLEYDAVIVDEASMVDLLLMQGLLRALPHGTRLVLVGDADQLPSVGAGNVLSDILKSEYLYAVQLKAIFRQAQESMIVVNAHRINRGEYPVCNALDSDFFLLEETSREVIRETILALCRERLPAHYDLKDPLRDIQVITPSKRWELGTRALNKALQQALNPPRPGTHEIESGDRVFREGDKVMQNKNNYLLKWKSGTDLSEGEGVFNGDVGYIHSIDEENGKLTVVFDDRFVTYDLGALEELEPAYAITVHKSQGSEFPVVVLPMGGNPPVLSTRHLLYTAITRAKQLVVLVGAQYFVDAMVDNNETAYRYSGLAARLRARMDAPGLAEWTGV